MYPLDNYFNFTLDNFAARRAFANRFSVRFFAATRDAFFARADR